MKNKQEFYDLYYKMVKSVFNEVLGMLEEYSSTVTDLEEAALILLIDDDFQYIARDKDGMLSVFKEKPMYDEINGVWAGIGYENINAFTNKFKCVLPGACVHMPWLIGEQDEEDSDDEE